MEISEPLRMVSAVNQLTNPKNNDVYWIPFILSVLEGIDSEVYYLGTAKNDSVDGLGYCDAFQVHQDILNTAHKATLAQLLYFAKYGTIVKYFQRFVKVVGHATRPYGYTYQSFGLYLSRFLLKFSETLIKLRCVKLNLVQLNLALDPSLTMLDLLYTLFERAILPIPELHPTSEYQPISLAKRSNKLLSAIYEMLKENYVIGQDQYTLIWNLFVNTSRVYFNRLEDLIFRNLADDQELFFGRNEDLAITSQNYWNDKYYLRSEASEIPTFLKPHINLILETAKSIEMMYHMEQNFSGIQRDHSVRKSLYDAFIEHVSKHLGIEPSLHEEASCKEKEFMDMEMNIVYNEDSFNSSIFNFQTKLFCNSESDSHIWPDPTPKKWDTDETVHTRSHFDHLESRGTPIEYIFFESLNAVLLEHQNYNKELCDTFKSYFNLLDHLKAVNSLYFFNHGSESWNIVCFLSERLWHGIPVNEVQLNINIRTEYQEKFGADNISLTITRDTNDAALNPNTIRNLFEINQIELSYKVEWPLTLFFKPEIMSTYNKIFAFLMRMTSCKYLLNGLSLQPGRKKHNLRIHHKEHLFRQQLIHFVSNIHQYIFDNIIQMESRFYQRIMDIGIIDDMSQEHNSFVDLIATLCFLDNSSVGLLEPLNSILDIVVYFCIHFRIRVADKGLGTIIQDKIGMQLENMRNDFLKHQNQFLTSLMNQNQIHLNLDNLLFNLNYNDFYDLQ